MTQFNVKHVAVIIAVNKFVHKHQAVACLSNIDQVNLTTPVSQW